jgi:hypothetical protein
MWTSATSHNRTISQASVIRVRSLRPLEETSFLPYLQNLTPRSRQLKMAAAGPDPDWLIFRNHEVKARMGIMTPPNAAKDLAVQWARLRTVEVRSAYVQCLRNIAASRLVYRASYRQAKALHTANRAQIPWHQNQIAVLRHALEALRHFRSTLRRFLAVQVEERRNGVMTANDSSRQWTVKEKRRIRALIKSAKEAIVEISPAAPQAAPPAPAAAPPAVPQGGEEEEEEEGEEGEERHTDDEGLPLGPSSHGDDESDFVKRWEAFLDTVEGHPDSREWKDLYKQARKLWKAGGPEDHPNEDDDDALQEFKDRTSRPLEAIVGLVGRAWQSHIDKVNVNEDGGTHQGVDFKVALRLAREAAMGRARRGGTDIWPRRRKTRRNMTAAETATKIGFGPELRGMEGRQWTYFTTIGSGSQGEASLWTSLRPDGNGNLVDVSFPSS